MISKSFQLLRTNPALTTNVKLVVTSNYKLYLSYYTYFLSYPLYLPLFVSLVLGVLDLSLNVSL